MKERLPSAKVLAAFGGAAANFDILKPRWLRTTWQSIAEPESRPARGVCIQFANEFRGRDVLDRKADRLEYRRF